MNFSTKKATIFLIELKFEVPFLGLIVPLFVQCAIKMKYEIKYKHLKSKPTNRQDR